MFALPQIERIEERKIALNVVEAVHYFSLLFVSSKKKEKEAKSNKLIMKL